MHKILPQIAGAEIRDHKTEMAEDHVGILLTVGSAGYSPNIRCTWKIVRIVANIPKLIRDGNWRVSEFWGPYKHRIASSEGYGPRQLTASCDQNQTGRKPPLHSHSPRFGGTAALGKSKRWSERPLWDALLADGYRQAKVAVTHFCHWGWGKNSIDPKREQPGLLVISDGPIPSL